MATGSNAKAHARSGLSRLRRSTWFRIGARVGYAVAGLLHVLIGVLAISVATGAGAEASQSGALAAIAGTPGGAVLLWVVVAGLLALGLWQVLDAITESDPDTKEETKKRVKSGGKAIAYLAVGLTAFRYARGGGGGGGEQQTEQATAGLLGSPLGVAVILLIAAVAIAIGIGFIASGVKKKFERKLVMPTGSAGRAVSILGQVGYIAKGVSVAVIGFLFAAAAFTADASKAGGLDAALKTLAGLPFGIVILSMVGIGLIAYGAFLGVRAWRAKLD